ncbi:MAG: isoprenylcysteine carboxylmethyltransferase family protein [Gemmatimonadota bacterium]|nr:MAG: isoprenylcysteine carboxylmethyltransferase family protein [Gemmatimonadota bacterium]
MKRTPHDQESAQTSMPVLLTRLLVAFLIMLLALWIPAWDLRWWQAWAYTLVLVVTGVGGRLWADRRHPGLLAERQSLENLQGAKPWDRVLAPLTAVSISLPLFIVAGLDHRHSWSPVFPTWLSFLGLILVTFGYAFSVWALVENRYFSSVVRIQKDRGHVVCDTGPYRVIRHPGYAGHLLALPGITLALGSLWTLIPAVVAFVIVVIRTALEDQTLQEELPGYREYARRVHFRLAPGIY